jgi:predicted metalloprotease with PDZ domain
MRSITTTRHCTGPRGPLAAIVIGLFALVFIQGAAAQPPEKKIGFGIQVYTDGFFSSTVTRIAVTQVVADSQAQSAGVAVGDELVRVQETVVPGGSATKLKEHLEFVPGVAKKITFRRANGSEYDVVFVRAAAPKS